MTLDIDLYICPECEFVFNGKYEQLDYNVPYDTYQGCSLNFYAHLSDMASRVAERAKASCQPFLLLEVGCGQGAFLHQVAEKLTSCDFQAIGFDPAYRGPSQVDGIHFLANIYPPPQDIMADMDRYTQFFIISRHVIEHVPDPNLFVSSLGTWNNKNINLFLETPDIRWTMENAAFEDMGYEHCSLYSPRSLQQLLLKHGFTIDRFSNVFHDQYLWVEAHKGESILEQCHIYEKSANEMAVNCKNLFKEKKGTFFIWGAAGKGVVFLNQIDPKCLYIEKAIDINPKKEGHFIPGTGHEIVPPSYLLKIKDDIDIIIMNENYTNEIKEMVEDMSLCHVEFYNAHGAAI